MMHMEHEPGCPYAAALPTVVDLAEKEGWLRALESTIAPIPGIGAALSWNATDESQGDLVFLLGVAHGSRVMHLGCEFGAVSVALARTGADCIVVGASGEEAFFTCVRCVQSGFSNVTAACEDASGKSCLADDSLDAVVVNHALERTCPGCACGWFSREARKILWEELRRVLKVGGQLVLATGRDESPTVAGFRRQSAYVLSPPWPHPVQFIPVQFAGAIPSNGARNQTGLNGQKPSWWPSCLRRGRVQGGETSTLSVFQKH